MTTLPELIANAISVGLNDDFNKGFGWCFTERFSYRFVLKALSLWNWPAPDGYSPKSLRYASEYTLPFPPSEKAGPPLNIDIVVLNSRHGRRSVVRARNKVRNEIWRYAAEVKWIAGGKATTPESANSDLERLVQLRLIKPTAQLHFIMAGNSSQIKAWTKSAACPAALDVAASCLADKYGACVFTLKDLVCTT